MTVQPDWFSDIPWWTSTTIIAPAVATVTAVQETATLVSSHPQSLIVGGANPCRALFYPGYGAPVERWTIVNTGPAKTCHISVVITTVNDVPPSTNGIQHGSDACVFQRVTGGYVVLENILNHSGQLVTTTYDADFVVPAFATTYYCGLFITSLGVSGPGGMYDGGSIDWSINFFFP